MGRALLTVQKTGKRAILERMGFALGKIQTQRVRLATLSALEWRNVDLAILDGSTDGDTFPATREESRSTEETLLARVVEETIGNGQVLRDRDAFETLGVEDVALQALETKRSGGVWNEAIGD